MKRLIVVLALLLPLASQAQKLEKATFAAGCFWCTEEALEKVPGVVSAVSATSSSRCAGCCGSSFARAMER